MKTIQLIKDVSTNSQSYGNYFCWRPTTRQQYSIKYEVREVPVPNVGSNDILIKVDPSYFCTTELTESETLNISSSRRRINPSNERVGVVVAVGARAQKSWSIGQRAGVILSQHQCPSCLPREAAIDVLFCGGVGMIGGDHEGVIVEYMGVDAEEAVRIPPSLSIQQAGQILSSGVSDLSVAGHLHATDIMIQTSVWTAIQSAGLKPTDTVAIVGIEGSGHFGVQFAKALGYQVVAVDDNPVERTVDLDLTLKGDLVVNFHANAAADEVNSWTGQNGLAAVIVCTESIPAILWACNLLREGGVIVEIGLVTTLIQFGYVFNGALQGKTIKSPLRVSRTQLERMMKVAEEFGISSVSPAVSTDPFSGSSRGPTSADEPTR